MVLRVLPWVEDLEALERLKCLLEPFALDVLPSPRAGRLEDAIDRSGVDIVIHFPAAGMCRDVDVEVVRQLFALNNRPPIVVMMGAHDAAQRKRWLDAGCLHVMDGIPTPSGLRDLFDELGEPPPADGHPPQPETVTQSVPPVELGDFRSCSDHMQAFLATAKRLVGTTTTLLLLGETGVGKEWMARAIHTEGDRKEFPFIPINCGAIPEGLLDSELFGHESGAFTGATRTRRGLFEMARGGTVFLDEIGEMPLHMQVKLLRVLQDHSIQRLGSEQFRPIDVRVMAATNRDLQAEVHAGRFREDLYYRLSVVTLRVPALREHPEDIPQLLQQFLAEYRARLKRDVQGFSDDALLQLCTYPWPGNVRELMNAVERAVLLCDDRLITTNHLPPHVGEKHDAELPRGAETMMMAAASVGAESVGTGTGPLRPMKDARAEMLAKWERAYLSRCLSESHGRIQEAAERAAINPRSLRDMMRRHGLRKEQFRWRPK